MKKLLHIFSSSILFISIISFFFCVKVFSQESDNESENFTQDTLIPPTVVLIDTCPAPQTIEVPIKPGGSYTVYYANEKLKIDLLPPTITLLDQAAVEVQGHSFFTSYTTDNGLALDGINCGFKDQSGNLWFGTAGGGVSRYDGKSFTTFTTTHGLSYNVVFSITEDQSGNLWFGTYGGVCLYDGKSFTNFTFTHGLTNDIVWCITEDQSGNLWFGTEGGVSLYDGKSFTNFTTTLGLANNDVRCITEDQSGNLWFGTVGGVSRYNPKLEKSNRAGGKSLPSGKAGFTNFTTTQGLANNDVRCITEDQSGNLWFGTNGGGISRYDGKSFTNFTTTQGLANNIVMSITADQSGNLWFGTVGGVSRYDPKLEKFNGADGKSLPTGKAGFTNFTTTQGLANNQVSCITEDQSGNLWFGTYGGGVSCYGGKAFMSFTTTQGLANNVVWCITEDQSGNFWFGTGGGVSRYDGRSFMNFTIAQGLVNNDVRSITEDQSGNLWFGTYGGGVSRYDGQSFTNFTTTQGLVNNTVLFILEDQSGNLWFGTEGGVSCYDGKSFTNFTITQGLADNWVLTITEDQSGNLWFGTVGGVSLYDPRLEKSNRASGKSLPALLSHGFSVAKPEASFTNFTTTHGLANNIVFSITEDQSGNLWFGTGGGVSRYDGNSFINFTTRDGLADDNITQIVILQDKIVIGSNLGVATLTHFTPKHAQSTAKDIVDFKEKSNILPQNDLDNSELSDYVPVFKIYNSATGYPVKDVNTWQNALFLDSKGIIWVGTGSDKTALVRIDFNAIRKNDKPPTVFLQSLKVNNENLCWYNLKGTSNNEQGMKNVEVKQDSTNDSSKFNIQFSDSLALINEEALAFGYTLDDDMRAAMYNKFGDIKFDSITRFYPIPENLVLPYKHNNITFEFVAIEPARPQLVKYQCMLEGYDKGWSPATNKTSASFGNIFEGTYTFKFKACGPDGIWSKPVNYTFKVLPPWWRTWWMYTIYTIVIIGMLYLLYRWRVTKLKKEKEILEKKVQVRTQEIQEKNEALKEQKEEILTTNEELEQQNEEIVSQRDEIEAQRNLALEQKDQIENQNKSITDSIVYAKRIQSAILPPEPHINELLHENFIFYKPRDIVSGDFYWVKQVNQYIILVAADCTGHGVPGAFMSMLGISYLNEIVQKREITKPNQVLNELRKQIKYSLRQHGQQDESRDGMDIALCVLDTKNNLMQYAGAFNPLYLIRDVNGKPELIETKADRMPVGFYLGKDKSFTNHEIQLEMGDTFYIFSDGFIDQFGGKNNKKYMSKNFKNLLLEIHEQPLYEQKEILDKTLKDWMDGSPQMDDILVIGVRV